VIKDAGHASNIDQPEAFNEAIVGFIDKLPPDPEKALSETS
jgi:pimeloyl-ACP methyl ester carboxylesterase